MKVFKRISVSVFALLLLILLTVLVCVQILKPTYSGTIKGTEASGVEVYYDTIGVPHIFAISEDKAMVALGYLHAKERLWQMELLRRIASGRLSEILGKDLLEVDVFFSSLGIDATVEKQVLALDCNLKVKTLVNAYLKGVNSYMDKGITPVEFTLLGIDKEHYTVKDMYYVTAYMAFSFAHAFKTDPLLSYIKQNLGDAYLRDLAVDVGAQDFYQKKETKAKVYAHSKVNSILNKLPFPQFMGSNGVVLSSKKTTTGSVLFENDPHIGYAQPCVWYQAHIKTPTYENYGFYLGLMPFPLMAHNREYAFGITMFENDDINFYNFKNHPIDTSKYMTSTGVHSYQYRKKKIKVKGESSKTITIKKTILGTVFNTQLTTLDSINPTAVQWVYNEKPNAVLQTSYGLNHAQNIKDFEKELSSFSAPGLNFIYGDKNNNIALWSVGKLFKLNGAVNTKFILNGLDTLQTEKKWLSFDKNPKTINPIKGYVLTSNTQPGSVDEELYQGYYLPRDRKVALEKRIHSKEKLSTNNIKNMAISHTNSMLINTIKSIVKGLNLGKLSDDELLVLDRLVKWKGNHSLDNIEPTIYYKLTFKLLKKTFEDELGEDLFKDFVQTNLCKRTQNKYLEKVDSPWWNNIHTKEKETFENIVYQSFKETVSELKIQLGNDLEDWKWRRVHTVTHKHALAKISVLKKLLNVAKTPIVGGNETINNTMFDYNEEGIYSSNAGPSTRRVVDFSDIENSWAVIPTGQSGNFLSPYYKNQAAYYNAGRYYKMLINEEEIKKSTQKLVFE